MDQSEDKLQSLGICHKLFNFIMKSLAAQALKPVTLGCPMHHGFVQVPVSDDLPNRVGSTCDRSTQPMAHGTPRDGAGSRAKVELEQARGLDNTAHAAIISSPSNDCEKDGKELPPVQDIEEKNDTSKAPKKSVSINDRAEEMGNGKKKKKKKRAMEKSASLEREKDEPKPLRSILKVGSNSNEKSNSFTDGTREATNNEG